MVVSTVNKSMIKDQLSDITVKDETIHHLSGQRLQSYALNWLFGTLDADDAQYYTDSINTLLNDNRQTQTLLKISNSGDFHHDKKF